MNLDVPDYLKNKYDLIIDPGAVEHFFNPGTSLENIASMLKVGGFAYHQCAISYCGHGFYSISPTLFVDFYLSNGFSMSRPRCWGAGTCKMDDQAIVSPLEVIDFDKEYPVFPGGPVAGVYVARKEREQPIIFPMQWRYDTPEKRSSRGSFSPIIEDILAGMPGILGGQIAVKGTPVPLSIK